MDKLVLAQAKKDFIRVAYLWNRTGDVKKEEIALNTG